MNEPKLCNQSQFYGFYFHVTDLFSPIVEGIEREANTVDIEYVEIKDIQTPKLLENGK
jgi:hypothetical protein